MTPKEHRVLDFSMRKPPVSNRKNVKAKIIVINQVWTHDSRDIDQSVYNLSFYHLQSDMESGAVILISLRFQTVTKLFFD